MSAPVSPRQAAQAWLALDPDPETRAATRRLLEEGDDQGLRSCFGQRLQFGTAGIRGALGPGPGRMNRALVRRVSAGLAAYLLHTVPDATERGVVVGFDGRHGSRAFAADTAAVLGAAGVPVFLHDELVPTPVLAHSLLHLGAAAGVMVTASHNPAADNGYKVYWGNGAQIVPPHDRGISEAIDAVDPAALLELPELELLRGDGLVRAVPASAWQDYLAQVLALRVHRSTGAVAVYTAMHGVGYQSLRRVLEAAGHTSVHAVAEQREPHPDFPTVAYPNPEEPGALDLAMARAAELGADLIVAHDPDADRLAVALPAGDGTWRRLTGNEVGLLLASDLLEHGDHGERKLVATTIVSTAMLADVAAAHGAELAETLTGFKWIADAAIAFEGDFVFGFEEALGYSAGPVVRDKDGVSAALLFLDLASWCKERGTTVAAHLEALYRRHGASASRQHSLKLPGLEGKARIGELMAALRAHPPESLGGFAVLRVRDILAGEAHDLRTGARQPIDLPRSNVLAFDLEAGHRVLARPSGTEPKLKFYFEARAELDEGEALAEAMARAEATMDALQAELLGRLGVA